MLVLVTTVVESVPSDMHLNVCECIVMFPMRTMETNCRVS